MSSDPWCKSEFNNAIPKLKLTSDAIGKKWGQKIIGTKKRHGARERRENLYSKWRENEAMEMAGKAITTSMVLHRPCQKRVVGDQLVEKKA